MDARTLTRPQTSSSPGWRRRTCLLLNKLCKRRLSKKFKGLGSVCLKPMEKGPHFRELLLMRSREFLDGKLDHSDPATVFFRYRTADGSAEPLIGEAFDEADS